MKLFNLTTVMVRVVFVKMSLEPSEIGAREIGGRLMKKRTFIEMLNGTVRDDKLKQPIQFGQQTRRK